MAERRKSAALGHVKVMTLDELNDAPPQFHDDGSPLRVLVTVHAIAPLLGNMYVKGLGLWVGYIIQKYLKRRNIYHRLYIKSILTQEFVLLKWRETTPEQIMNFCKRNKIDVLIPSDVTDTMFIAQHYEKISPLVRVAITSDLSIYQTLEDKWDTFNLCKDHGIATPLTELFDPAKHMDLPFFLKVASGTNAGRGVWHVKNDTELQEALQAKEARGKGVLLLAQKPTYGEIICAEIIYQTGKPVGFFFAKSVQADDLAGMGGRYVFSQAKEYKQMYSHEKVVLDDKQWEAVTKIFQQIGQATKYHGMIDIEFIVAGEGNAHAEPGSVWLLECNPRFSGDIHTTLSNPGFLDLYLDVLYDRVDTASADVGNYSLGVDMKSSFGDFYPTKFYVENPFHVLNIRQWHIDNYHSYDPKKDKKKLAKEDAAAATATTTTSESQSSADPYPQFNETESAAS